MGETAHTQSRALKETQPTTGEGGAIKFLVTV